MYQLRYLVYIWLISQGQYMFAQDRLEQSEPEAHAAPIALQTPLLSDEVKPVVDPAVHEPVEEHENAAARSESVIESLLPVDSEYQYADLEEPHDQSIDADRVYDDNAMPAILTSSEPLASFAPLMPAVGVASEAPSFNAPADVKEMATESKGVDEKAMPVPPEPLASPAPSASFVPSLPTIGAAPEVPTPNVPVDAQEESAELKGIDTVDLDEPEGNWLFKRLWWEKSKEVYGKIRERVDKIVEARMHFFKERTRLAYEVVNPFYVNIGFEEGELRESIKHLEHVIKKAEEQDNPLSSVAQEKLIALQEEKAAIAKLAEAVDSVRDIGKNLDDSLEKLLKQIALARSYESEAWQKLDQIAEELNDKKAREHYYAIATFWRNIKEIGNYIQGPFAQHFVQLAQASVQSVQSIKSLTDMLQKKGFDLKEHIELSPKDVEPDYVEDDEDLLPKQPELGWSAWAWKMITDWFSW